KIRANCAARTVVDDIKPIADIQQRTGVPIECCAFIGSSPIRQYAEGWSLDFLQKATEEALTFAVKEGLTAMYVTEDTTRADPESLRRLFTTAIRSGAKRICVADTVGHATPNGAKAVVTFVKSVITELGVDVGIDWHEPVIGADAFRTATGVHAAAVVKAFRKNDRPLMDAVYAAVPASLVGRQQEIEVGPMSGKSNVVFWLESRGLPATDEIVDRIYAAAKASDRMLTHEQIQNLVGAEAVLK